MKMFTVLLMVALSATYFGVNAMPAPEQDPPSGQDLCPVKADIIFVLSASAHISKAMFDLQINFLLGLVGHVQVGHAHVQFGAVLYGGKSEPLFYLNDSSSHERVYHLLSSASQQSALLDVGLDMPLQTIMQHHMFNVSMGGRPDAIKVVIFLGAEISIMSQVDSLLHAQKLKEDIGAKMIVVGLGLRVDLGLLLKIASGPSSVFRLFACAEVVAEIQLAVWAEACPAGDDDDDSSDPCVDVNSHVGGMANVEAGVGDMLPPALPELPHEGLPSPVEPMDMLPALPKPKLLGKR